MFVNIPNKLKQGKKEKNLELSKNRPNFWMVSLITSIIFGTFVITGAFIMTLNTFVVLIAFVIFTFSPLVLKHFKKQLRFKINPSIILFVILPLSYVVVSNNTFFDITNIIDMIIVYNYNITFLLLATIIPLALFHKFRESCNTSCFNPMLSIIIPIFNEEKTIARTIDSILSSDYKKKEIIAINNGSTDKTKSILQKYEQKIKIYDEGKKGKANAINRGLSIAKGEIIVIIDADTVIMKDAFANIVKPFSDPKIGAVTGNIKVLNPKNIHSKLQVLEYAMASQIGKAALASQQAVNIISGAFGAFRRDAVITETPPFTEDTLTEDLDATVTILKQGYRTTMQNDAIALTEVPFTFKDLLKQRTRWCRGLIQGYIKHPDLIKNPPFEHIPSLIYFLSFNFSIIVPIVTLINTFSLISSILLGNTWFALMIFLLNFVVANSLFLLSLVLDNQKIKYAKLFPLAFLYFVVHNFIFVKALCEQIFDLKPEWNHIKREEISARK